MSPDLICVLDTVSGEAIGTETVRYGQRVTVVALPAPPIFLTPKGLEHVGPRAFGYDLDFRTRCSTHEAIGIDVGGTNTDAVLLDGARVLHAIKTPTTEDVITGIRDALEHLRPSRRRRGDAVDGVVIGTTHFINAVVQRRDARAGRRPAHRPAGQRAACRRSATGRRTWPAWCAASSPWSKAGTNTTAGRSCRSTKPACATPRGAWRMPG